MGSLLERFLPRTEFSSYEDFKQNYRVSVPEDFNFGYDVVDAWSEMEPEKRALYWVNDAGGEAVFTFADISRESNRIANMLKGRGVKKGDMCLLILKQRYEYWMAAAALHKIGAVLIPGSVQMMRKDIAYRANAAGVKVIFAIEGEGVPEHVEEALPDSPTVTDLFIVGQDRDGWTNLTARAEFSGEFPRPVGAEATRSDEIFLCYFTSGTTGQPKMVAHAHSYPLGHITTAAYWQKVVNDGLHLTVSDSAWAKFGWGKIYGQWIAGATIFAYDMDRFNAHNMLSIIQKYKINTFCAPPTMYRFFIKEDLSKYDLSSIVHASLAGEPLNPEVFQQFLGLTGLKLFEGFGQSESSVILANFEWFEPRPGSTGKPSPMYDIDLVDDDGKSVPDGEEGEIVIRLDKQFPVGLLRGYYVDGELDTSCHAGNIYRLGDLAWRDVNGYYWFVGRNDDIIKCSGYRVGPFEVESALVEHKAVLESAVSGVPDPERGQIVKATVVLAKGYEPSDELVRELQNHVKKTTAPYKYPRVIEFVPELPKTLGGKIKRKEIRRGDERKLNDNGGKFPSEWCVGKSRI
ncbi:MAG: AMP-binding protein [Clostridiales bacterium]|jgi:acetyl-CoA synthetase|nr:AMP-binding protein [Clostridiales bacterium]